MRTMQATVQMTEKNKMKTAKHHKKMNSVADGQPWANWSIGDLLTLLI